MKRQRGERSRKRGRTSTSGSVPRTVRTRPFPRAFLFIPSRKLSSTVVRSSVTREDEFREEFSKKRKTTKDLSQLRLTRRLYFAYEGGEACDSNIFASVTRGADLSRALNDDDSMNRRRMEHVDENISTSGKFSGGIFSREDRRGNEMNTCAK